MQPRSGRFFLRVALPHTVSPAVIAALFALLIGIVVSIHAAQYGCLRGDAAPESAPPDDLPKGISDAVGRHGASPAATPTEGEELDEPRPEDK